MNKIQTAFIESYNQRILSLLIDGVPLDQYIADIAGDPSYRNLWSAWLPLNDMQEEKYIKTLLQKQMDCNIPVLLCPDDMDLSCTIIVAKICHQQNTVRWDAPGLVRSDNWNRQIWVNSGIRDIKNWSDEDWNRYGDMAWWDTDDERWDDWCAGHWAEEIERRLWNYEHLYLNDDTNIEWFEGCELIFDRKEYEDCVRQFITLDESTVIGSIGKE